MFERAETAERRRADDEMLREWGYPLIAEFIGAFTLVFIGAGSIIMTQGTNLVAIALAHGLAVAVMLGAAGHVSGGAYNPAVTVGLVIGNKLTPMKAAGYIVAQLLGAVVAALMLKAVFPDTLTDPVHLGVPAIGDGFSERNALIAEMVTSFFLTYVIFGAAIDQRGPTTIAALAIGLTITMDTLGTGAISGAAMNPARWFGPALVDSHWDSGWIWIVGPSVGAIVAAVLYTYVYLQGREAVPHTQPPGADADTR